LEFTERLSGGEAPVRVTAYSKCKRTLDIIGAIVLLVVLSPLLLLIAIAICLDSPGTAIYQQTRVGRQGIPFTILKFRTMQVNAPTLSTAEMQCLAQIPYTRLGIWLRRSSLDELPQLWNVLAGQMSFIGPRPALPSQTDVNTLRAQYGADAAYPGITGLAQIMGRDELDVETKVGYDAAYCRQLSFQTDLNIFLRTFAAVKTGQGNK